MSNLNAAASWDAVVQLESTMSAVPSTWNTPNQALLNRTEWLKTWTVQKDASGNCRITGNLTIDVAPNSSWGSAYRTIDMRTFGAFWDASTGQSGVGANVYNDGAVWRLRNGGPGLLYQQNVATSAHEWLTGPTGTGGGTASLVRAMLLDANRNLGLGVAPNPGWTSSGQVQVAAGKGISSLSGNMLYSANYYLGSVERFGGTGFSLQYQQDTGAGAHKFWTSTVSGVADAAVTFALNATLDSSGWRPGVDNTSTLGSASLRWSTIYAGTGTINTSDENLKQDIEDLSAAERAVAERCRALVKKFRFRDAVAEKGAQARLHIGVIAQDVEAAFQAEGLDPTRYALFCRDTWWEGTITVTPDPTDDEPNPTPRQVPHTSADAFPGAAQVTRLGIRYEELLAFIIASI